MEVVNFKDSNDIFQIAYQRIANVSYFCIIKSMTMNKYLYILFVIVASVIAINKTFSQTRPNKIAGLQLWLRADSNVVLNGNTVSAWNDCSGKGNNAIQSNPANQPIFTSNCIAGLPAIIFNGNSSKQFLLTPKGLFNGDTAITLFFVIKLHDGSTNSGIWGSNMAYNNFEFLASNGDASVNGGVRIKSDGVLSSTNLCSPINSWNFVTLQCSPKINTYKSGSTISTNVGNSLPIANDIQQAIGRYAGNVGSYFGNFDLTEMLFYNKSLSLTDRNEIENYFKIKYSKPAVLLANDIIINNSICDTIIHAGKGYENYLWNTGETTESIKVNKTGTYRVETTDIFGISSKDSIAIIYTNYPNTISDTTICPQTKIIWDTELNPSNFSFKWNTGEKTPSISINQAGAYAVTITDSKGCTVVSKPSIISIDGFNKNIDLGSDTTLCKNNKISVQKGESLCNSFLWNDGSTNKSLAIKKTGKYYLTVTDKYSCMTFDSITVTISGSAPIPDFNYVISSNNTVQFSNMSSPLGSNWNWNFGDGTNSSNSKPLHSYSIGGTYTVELKVSDNLCHNSLTKIIYLPVINKTGLLLWLRSDSNVTSNGSLVSSWNDCSGNNTNVIQQKSIYQPSLKTNSLNGYPLIHFDGVDDYLNGGDICDVSASGITIFTVGKYTSGEIITKGKSSGIWPSYGLGISPSSIYYGLITDIDNSIVVPNPLYPGDIITQIINRNTAKQYAYLNGVSKGSTIINSKFTAFNDYYFLVGAYGNETGTVPPCAGMYLNGDIAEIIIYNKPLTETERISVETYLKNKYSPKPISLGDDIVITQSLCPTTIHAGKGYASYLWSTGETTESITVNKTGKYLINVTDTVFGYESSDDINVTFNIEPHIIQDTTICPKASLSWDTKLNTTDFNFKWSTGETTSSITIKNAGNYILTVNDKFGCSYISDTVNVKIDDFDKSIDLGKDTTLCKNNELELVKGADRAVQYLWSDGTHNKTMILVSGDKYYYVTATDKYTCTAKDSIKIKVQGIAPTTPFTMTGHCQKNEITLKDNSVLSDNTTKIIAYKWIIESDTLLSKDTSYIFKNAGLFYIKHIAITNGACSGSKTLPITIDPIPSISFIPSSICQYSPANFINTSSFNKSNSESILWNIEGLKIEGKDTTTHIFKNYGYTPVSLTITTKDNCTDSLVKKVEVKFSPKAKFTNTPACGLIAYLLEDKSTSPFAYGLTSRNWYVNDLTSQEESFISFPDSTLKGDNVLLKVTGVNGCFDTVSRFIPYSPIPKAALEFKKSCVGDLMKFSNKSTVASGKISEWKWNIGSTIERYNSNTSVNLDSLKSPSLPVTLIVKSNMGCSDTISKVIKIPKVAFDYKKGNDDPRDITFSKLIYDSTMNYKWTFGDTDSSTEINPRHIYDNSGVYAITLYAYNANICVSSDTTIKLPKYTLDIALLDIQKPIKINDEVTIKTLFKKTGTMPITNINFIITTDNDNYILKHWSERDTAGGYETLTFETPFKAESPKYICIDASFIGKDSNVVKSIQKCITLIKEFTFFTAYPNPADDYLTLDFISPENGTAQYYLYNNIGQIIQENSVTIVEGINKLTIPTDNLNQGYYNWKLNVAGKEKTGQFLIKRSSK